MKEIKLKILDADKPTQLDYKALITTMIQTPSDPRAGLSLDDVRKGVRVLEALEISGEVLKLEDADYSLLTTKLKTFKFGIAHKNIIEFADDINNAKEVK